MKLFFEHSLSSENLPSDESVPSLKPEEQLIFRPNSISGNPSENSVDAFSSLFNVVISDVEENAFNDQINLAEEFNNFAAAIIGRKLASVQNVKLWIDLSEASADFYLDSFTFAEISNFIALFLNEIENKFG
uniref:Uncharacterized protein n=1 Tax=Panagrolaimus superbus TaxID=310955 RepID=A0A914YYL6_9BILA